MHALREFAVRQIGEHSHASQSQWASTASTKPVFALCQPTLYKYNPRSQGRRQRGCGAVWSACPGRVYSS